jgi:4-amino-4-deoxy-L-arabinose transferase-like glycosyltransferase
MINLNKENFFWFFALLVCGLTAMWNLSGRAMENHECYVSVTAREMIRNKDWVLPKFNGEPRLAKTPLCYWLTAGTEKITGKFDDFTARFPSSTFALLSALSILYFVKQSINLRTGIISALVWATSFSYINYAHNARPEMALTFFITLCLLSFYSAVAERNRKKQIAYMLIFWTGFGLGMLAKGPAPIPLLAIPIFFYFLIFKEWKTIPRLLPIAGVIIFFIIVLPWPLAIGHRVNWNLIIWKQNFFDRLIGDYAPGNYPFYLYVLYTFSFIIPWSGFVPIALLSPLYKIWEEKRKFMLYLLICFAANFIFLTLSVGKRKHYLLPIMPVLAVLIGIILEDMIFVRKSFTTKFAKNFLFGHIIVLTLGAGVSVIYFYHSQFFIAALVLAITAIIFMAMILTAFAYDKTTVAAGLIFTFCCIFAISLLSLSAPYDNNNYTREFAFEISKIVPPDSNIIAYKFVSPRLVYYMDRIIPKAEDMDSIFQHYDKGDWIIATDSELKELQSKNRMNIVYSNEKAAVQSDRNIAGAVFRKVN